MCYYSSNYVTITLTPTAFYFLGDKAVRTKLFKKNGQKPCNQVITVISSLNAKGHSCICSLLIQNVRRYEQPHSDVLDRSGLLYLAIIFVLCSSYASLFLS